MLVCNGLGAGFRCDLYPSGKYTTMFSRHRQPPTYNLYPIETMDCLEYCLATEVMCDLLRGYPALESCKNQSIHLCMANSATSPSE